MLFAFVDESYSRDRYYVCAYVVDDAQFGAVKAAIEAARLYARGFGIEGNVELHGYEIMSGVGDWSPVRGQARAAMAIYSRALSEIAHVSGARLFVQGVDVTRLNARYSYPEPPHRIALRHVLEDVDRFAIRVGEEVVVIEDELPDQAEHARRVESYQRLGTGGYKPRSLQAIQLPIQFGRSAESPGLQAADLSVYLYRRLDSHVEIHPRTRDSVERMWRQLRPLKPVVRRWDP